MLSYFLHGTKNIKRNNAEASCQCLLRHMLRRHRQSCCLHSRIKTKALLTKAVQKQVKASLLSMLRVCVCWKLWLRDGMKFFYLKMSA